MISDQLSNAITTGNILGLQDHIAELKTLKINDLVATLGKCIINGHLPMIKYLHETVGIDILCHNSMLVTFVYKDYNLSILKYFKEIGADLSCMRDSCIRQAIEYCQIKIIKYLVSECSIDISKIPFDTSFRTYNYVNIHKVINDSEVVKLLISSGIDSNIFLDYAMTFSKKSIGALIGIGLWSDKLDFYRYYRYMSSDHLDLVSAKQKEVLARLLKQKKRSIITSGRSFTDLSFLFFADHYVDIR